MGFLKEFKEFAMRGSVVDLAVGVIIGGAFGKIVTSLVDDIIMPPIGYVTGGVGYLNKNTAMAELANAIQTIKERGRYMSNEVKDLYVQKLTQSKSQLHSKNPLSKLSNREVDVAKHLIQGLGIIEVSNELNLSASTISTYKSRIFEKLNVSNIPELIELFRLHSEN